MRGHNTTVERHDLEAIARSPCHGSGWAASLATRNALPFSAMAVRSGARWETTMNIGCVAKHPEARFGM
jgi:hypothetical protein